jgi:hypothetical protein
MRTFRPGFIPDDQKQLASAVRAEIQAIHKAANASEPFLAVEELHEAPKRVYEGQIALADGSDWNPGSGGGLYLRTGTVWARLVSWVMGAIYDAEVKTIKDVEVGGNQVFDGRYGRYTVDTGATNLLVLDGYAPVAKEIYVSDGRPASDPLFVINSGRFARLLEIVVVNAGDGGVVLLEDTDVTGVNLARIDGLDAEDFTTIGVDMRHSVTQVRGDSIHLGGIIDFVLGLGKPRAGSIGWKQVTPVTNGLAVGGHQIHKLNCATCETGIYLEDAQLSSFDQCVADSCSGFGVYIVGASTQIDFTDLFVGTSRGVYVGGTSVVHINGLRTVYNGVVPPWGQVAFFTGAAYDLTVADTAKLTVSSWTGDRKVNVASGAKLIVLDGENFKGRSAGTVAIGTTVYLAEAGAAAAEGDATWRAPANGRLLRLCPTVDTAPGAAQTFTYTARVNAADSALVATITGAASFGGVDTWETNGGIAVNKGDSISIKLVTSAAAGVGQHYCELQFIPD